MLRNRKALLLGLVFAGPAAAQSAPAPAGEDWGQKLVDITNQTVSAYGGLLLHDGLTILGWSLALVLLWIMLNWGLDKGLSMVFTHHDHHPFPLSRIVKTFGKAGVLVFLLNHYTANFPGLQFSFHNFPQAVAKHFVLVLRNAGGAVNQTDILMQYLQTPATLIAAPLNSVAVVDGLVYLAVHLWSGLISFAMFFLGGLGFVLSGVLVVIGPAIFVLWLWGGIPGQWAWNWFNALMAVASYRVFGEILQTIMSQMWIDFIQNTLNGDTSIANWIAHGGVCVYLTLFHLLAITMVPLLAGVIFVGAHTMTQAGANAVIGAAGSAVNVATKIVAAVAS